MEERSEKESRGGGEKRKRRVDVDQWKKEDMKESRYGGLKGGMRVEVDQWKRERHEGEWIWKRGEKGE